MPGGNRKLGHDEKKNKKCSGKGVIDLVISRPLCPLIPIYSRHLHYHYTMHFILPSLSQWEYTDGQRQNQKAKEARDIFHKHDDRQDFCVGQSRCSQHCQQEKLLSDLHSYWDCLFYVFKKYRQCHPHIFWS